MLRPHTLPGGSLSWPLYIPYELYGRVDPVYSSEAYWSGLGWTGAQGLGNVFETIAYFAYLWVILAYGQSEGRGAGVWGYLGPVGEKRRVHGWWGAVASLLGYTTFAITVMKSVLYCESLLSLSSNFQKYCLLTLISSSRLGYNDAFMGFPLIKKNSLFHYIMVFLIPK